MIRKHFFIKKSFIYWFSFFSSWNCHTHHSFNCFFLYKLKSCADSTASTLIKDRRTNIELRQSDVSNARMSTGLLQRTYSIFNWATVASPSIEFYSIFLYFSLFVDWSFIIHWNKNRNARTVRTIFTTGKIQEKKQLLTFFISLLFS